MAHMGSLPSIRARSDCSARPLIRCVLSVSTIPECAKKPTQLSGSVLCRKNHMLRQTYSFLPSLSSRKKYAKKFLHFYIHWL